MQREVNNKTINYNLRFIDSARFMDASLDAHVNNLSELFNCKCTDKKKQQIKIKCVHKIVSTRCKTCAKKSKQALKLLKDKFPCIYRLAKNNIDKFLLLLRKGVYPYEHIDIWERIIEEQLPTIQKFYSNLNIKHIN